MTLIDDTPINRYISTGGTDYPFTWPIWDDEDIEVSVYDVSAETLTVLDPNTDYNVTFTPGLYSGGTVTTNAPITSGDIVTIIRVMPVERDSDLTRNAVLIDSLNSDLDKINARIQDTNERVDRCWQVKPYDTAGAPVVSGPRTPGNALTWAVDGSLTTLSLTGSQWDALSDLASNVNGKGSDLIAVVGTADNLTDHLAAHFADTSTHGVTGEIVGTGDVQTLGNKTLTTPIIANFLNAKHDHYSEGAGGYIYQPGHIVGCRLTWDSGVQITIGTGQFAAPLGSGTPRMAVATSAMSKAIDAVWAAGSGQGGRVGTLGTGWWHVFALTTDADTYPVPFDYGFDQNVNATNLLADSAVISAGYNLARRVGSVYYAAGIIKFFHAMDDFFMWDVPFQEANNTNIAATRTDYTIRTPANVTVNASLLIDLVETETDADWLYGLVTSVGLGQTDTAPTSTRYNLAFYAAAASNSSTATLSEFPVSNGSIGIRFSHAHADLNAVYRIMSLGYRDTRDFYQD